MSVINLFFNDRDVLENVCILDERDSVVIYGVNSIKICV